MESDKYGDFLKKFSLWQEEMRCDEDAFDLGFYAYGLRVYGNMPLVEPMETREAKKIREIVIVVDTSYSTRGELIEGFLRETFQILSQRDSFFARSRIRVLQCDERVQRDTLIQSQEDFKALQAERPKISIGFRLWDMVFPNRNREEKRPDSGFTADDSVRRLGGFAADDSAEVLGGLTADYSASSPKPFTPQ